LASASAGGGFLSPFLDSDLITFCRVHGTGAREKRVSFGSNGSEFGAYRRARPARAGGPRRELAHACFIGLTGVRGGAVGVPGGPVSPARDDSAPTSRATNPPPPAVAGDELALKLDCPASPPAATTCK
jgi:hypothetical protein